MDGFTVVEVIRDLGFDPEPRISWPIGAAVRNVYQDRYGSAPPKSLRPKTVGHGSHCFAVYPDSFRPVAEELVSAILAEFKALKLAQGELFP